MRAGKNLIIAQEINIEAAVERLGHLNSPQATPLNTLGEHCQELKPALGALIEMNAANMERRDTLIPSIQASLQAVMEYFENFGNQLLLSDAETRPVISKERALISALERFATVFPLLTPESDSPELALIDAQREAVDLSLELTLFLYDNHYREADTWKIADSQERIFTELAKSLIAPMYQSIAGYTRFKIDLERNVETTAEICQEFGLELRSLICLTNPFLGEGIDPITAVLAQKVWSSSNHFLLNGSRLALDYDLHRSEQHVISDRFSDFRNTIADFYDLIALPA